MGDDVGSLGLSLVGSTKCATLAALVWLTLVLIAMLDSRADAAVTDPNPAPSTSVGADNDPHAVRRSFRRPKATASARDA